MQTNYLRKSRQRIANQTNAAARVKSGPVAPMLGEGWRDWLSRVFWAYVTSGFAPRHVEFWLWVWALTAGVAARHFIGVWPRGSGKSTSAELAVTAVAARRSRRYVLYVCDTQDQADRHVQNIAAMMERAGFERELNKFGSAKGWRRQQLRAAGGFKIDGIGLDTAARGIKVDMDRPDMIVVDDIDNKVDTPARTKKKIEALTMTILPTMAKHGVVLAIQNLVIPHGVFARLVDGRADYLTDRYISGPVPAIDGLQTERREVDGIERDVIIAGTATWAGQDLPACQHAINTWGLLAFKQESQHLVGQLGRYFRKYRETVHVGATVWRYGQPVWCAFDYGYGHNTAFGVLTREASGRIVLLGEWVDNHLTVAEHNTSMLELLARLGIKGLPPVVAGHDVFATDRNGKKIADDYHAYGWRMSPANTSRITGWHYLRQLLGDVQTGVAPQLLIDTSCARVQEFMREAIADPARPDDVLKTDSDPDGIGGDDAGDMLRYGIMYVYGQSRGWSKDDMQGLSTGKRV